MVHPLTDLLEEQSLAESYYSTHHMRTFSTSNSTSKPRDKMG